MARRRLAARLIVGPVWLAAGLVPACTEELRSPRVLTEEPVVMAISLSVIADGPFAGDLAPLPADRPRAEVLPLDLVELDALVANIDGTLALDDAAWVLCGNGCLSAMAFEGERHGALTPCVEDAAASSFACLAARGARPHVVLPTIFPTPDAPVPIGADAFLRVAVIVGRPEGPTTDECLQQLVVGPRTQLWGCAIGVRDLPYGPYWVFPKVWQALGFPPLAEEPALPELVAELLPPNAAPRIEAVRVGGVEDFPQELGGTEAELEPRSIHDVIELEVGVEAVVMPVIEVGDQQLELWQLGPEEWIGRYEVPRFQVWSNEPGVWGSVYFFNGSFPGSFRLHPSVEGPARLYVVANDGREGLSWFTLDVQVVSR